MRRASLNGTLAAFVLAGLNAWPVEARCQRFWGQVTSSSGDALAASHVLLERADVPVAAAMTDSNGLFSISVSLEPGSKVVLRFRHIGYRFMDRAITLEDGRKEYLINVKLDRIAVELSEIAVTAHRTERRLHQAGFYEREKEGFGHFVTEAQIRARNARYVTDVLRTVPGLRFAPIRGRSGYDVYVSRAQGRATKGACSPKVFLDGTVTTPDFDTYLPPEEIAAIEIYRGPAETPAQFGGAESDCGVIVIWTK